MGNYTLISTFDDNDKIKLEVPEGEDPATVALDELGWFIVKEEEEK